MEELVVGSNDDGWENSCYGGQNAIILPAFFIIPRKIFSYNSNDLYDICYPKSGAILGFGDVVIPGILVAYSCAFDRNKKIPFIYFTVSMIFYAIGLICTFLAMSLMKRGQPALLYLVPFTTIPVCIVSLIRKEFYSFWNGLENINTTTDIKSMEKNKTII